MARNLLCPMKQFTNKSDLRDHLQTIRASLSDVNYVSASQSICSVLSSLPFWKEGACAHVFWPMIEKREPDIRPFIRTLLQRQLKVVLPVVKIFSREHVPGGRMVQQELTSFHAVHQNERGMTEPDGESIVSIEEIDVIVVPAMGIDRAGYRIGYGFGYYDEFLATMEIPSICPIFARCVVDSVPHEAHDIPVSMVVTEENAFRVKKT